MVGAVFVGICGVRAGGASRTVFLSVGTLTGYLRVVWIPVFFQVSLKHLSFVFVLSAVGIPFRGADFLDSGLPASPESNKTENLQAIRLVPIWLHFSPNPGTTGSDPGVPGFVTKDALQKLRSRT